MLGLDDDPHTDVTAEGLVVQQTFPVTVVVLDAEILVAPFGQAKGSFEHKIGVEIPPAPFGVHSGKGKTPVRGLIIGGYVPITGIAVDVLVFLGRPEGHPNLELQVEIAVDRIQSGEADFVHASVPDTVPAVGFVFHLKEQHAHHVIVEDNVVAHAQRRVVHRLGKGGGLFVNIPERTLGIGEKHVHLVREDALDEPVHDAHLKFGIAIWKQYHPASTRQ